MVQLTDMTKKNKPRVDQEPRLAHGRAVKKLDCFLFYVIAAAASEPEANEAKDLIEKKLQYRGQPLFVQNVRNCGRR